MATVKEIRLLFSSNVASLRKGLQTTRTELQKVKEVGESVSNTIGTNLDKSFEAIGNRGRDMQNLGGSLTKYLTLPVLGLISAAAGVTAAFGWGRLRGIDSARAQLEGLGYSAQEVEEISKEVTDAIAGGMMTMAEGTSTAAGALAAGVERGAELEKYLKLVDAAAVGANRPVNEMATIFNRVQGSGKLMTEELNQIEDGMPGFSLAMAEHLGVTYEEFRKMVTEGQVSSDDFLTVMEGFAGGMAAAYSKSFDGMVANTKANVGIIGQTILGGVFEQSKEVIEDFLNYLRSDDLRAWAARTGEAIGNAFTRIVEAIRTGIEWFTNLSGAQQKMAAGFAVLATSIGPIFLALGTLFIWIQKIGQAITPLLFKVNGEGGLVAAFRSLGSRLSFLFGPIGILIGVFATLGTVFVTLWTKSEMFRNTMKNLWSLITESVTDFMSLFTGLGGTISRLTNRFTVFFDAIKRLFAGDTLGGEALLMALGFDGPTIDRIIGGVESIKTGITQAFSSVNTFINRLRSFKDALMAIFTGNDLTAEAILLGMGLSGETIDRIFGVIDRIKQGFNSLKTGVSIAFTAIGTVIQTAIGYIITIWDTYGVGIFTRVQTLFMNVFNLVRSVFSQVVQIVAGAVQRIAGFWQTDGQQIMSAVSNVFNFVWNIIKTVMAIVVPIVAGALNAILAVFNFIFPAIKFVVGMVMDNIKGVINGALTFIMGLVQLFSGIFTGDFSKMWEAVKNIFSGAIQFVWNLFQLMFWGRLVKGITSFVQAGLSLFRNFGSNVGTTFLNMFNRVVNIVSSLVRSVLSFFTNLWTRGAGIIRNLNTSVNTIIQNLVTGFISRVRNLFNTVMAIFGNLRLNAALVFQIMRQAIQNTILRLYTGVSGTVTRLRATVSNIFNALRNAVQNTILRMYTSVSGTITRLRNTASNIFNAMRNAIQNIVLRLYTSVTGSITRLRNSSTNIFTALRNAASNIFNAMKNALQNIVLRLYTAVSGSFTRLGNNVRNAASTMRDRVMVIYNNMKDRISSVLDRIVNFAKELPGRIGRGISNMKSKAVDGIKSMGNSMIDALEKVINKVVNGMNNITGKLGITATIDSVDIPRFSTGTGGPSGLVRNGEISRDTMAMVGDKGPGNGKGTRELVQFPDGSTHLFDNNAIIAAGKGTKIWSNRETEMMLGGLPKFSRGTMKPGSGTGSKEKDEGEKKGLLSSLWQKGKDLAGTVFDYIKEPGKVLDGLVESIAPDWGGLSGWAGTMAKGGFKFVKDKMLDFITNIFKENEGGEVNGEGILGRRITAKFGNYPADIARQLGVTKHYGLDTAHRYESLTSPVTGKVTKVWHDTYGGNAIQIKAGDLDWWFMHMQSIARKVGDVVKAGSTKLGITGNTGLRTTGYHLHTQAMRGGIGNQFAIDPLPLLRNAMGSITDGVPSLSLLNEEGFKESIISHNPKHSQRSRNIWETTGNMLGFTSDNNELERQLIMSNSLLGQILAAIYETEGGDLYMDKEKVGRVIAPVVARVNGYKDRRANKFEGSKL